MAQELDLGGTIYVSSKRAAELTGYAQDYIGQIARAGHIDAKKVSGLWYVRLESLTAYKEKADAYKPEPPARPAISQDLETTLSFDGKEYISAARAALLTGYSSDYVGQLAREGTVLGRQVGNRWFVDRDAIVKHKSEKDALLAHVQVDSVGLARYGHNSQAPQTGSTSLHYTYDSERRDLMPQPKKPESAEVQEATLEFQEYGVAELQREIPIRVIVPHPAPVPRSEVNRVSTTTPKGGLSRYLLIILPISAVGILVAGVYLLQRDALTTSSASSVGTGISAGSPVLEALRGIFAKKIIYTREF